MCKPFLVLQMLRTDGRTDAKKCTKKCRAASVRPSAKKIYYCFPFFIPCKL